MRRMGGMDAAFLYGETPSWHMHVSAVLVADPSGLEGGFSVERLKETMRARLGQVPQFRWKHLEVPFGIARPVWVEDRDFDIDAHVRRIGVPAPGGPRELGELIGDLVSTKLDRRRPLWELWVVEGLDDGNVAVLAKVHHAIIDGVSGAELATVLLDLEPDPGPPPVAVRDTLAHQREPSQAELFGRGVLDSMLVPWRAARLAGQLTRQAATAVPFLRRPRAPKIMFQAPRTPWNGTITPHRRFATARVPLDAVKELRAAFDVKLNDVVLALCAGALRRYLEREHAVPADPLVAQVPVSLRAADQRGDVGNRVGYMFASLATDVADPADRLAAIAASTADAKEMREALSARQIMSLSDTTPPGLIALAARTYTAAGLEGGTPPAFNVIISNVPGPPMPLYVAGAELQAMYPLGPLLYGGGLNITVISYRDSVDVGFLSCRELLPHPEHVAEGVPLALDELQRAARAEGPRARS